MEAARAQDLAEREEGRGAEVAGVAPEVAMEVGILPDSLAMRAD